MFLFLHENYEFEINAMNLYAKVMDFILYTFKGCSISYMNRT